MKTLSLIFITIYLEIRGRYRLPTYLVATRYLIRDRHFISKRRVYRVVVIYSGSDILGDFTLINRDNLILYSKIALARRVTLYSIVKLNTFKHRITLILYSINFYY